MCERKGREGNRGWAGHRARRAAVPPPSASRFGRTSPVPAGTAPGSAPLRKAAGSPLAFSLVLVWFCFFGPAFCPRSCLAAGGMLGAGLALALCALQLCPAALGGSYPQLLVERSGSRRLSKVRASKPLPPAPLWAGQGAEGAAWGGRVLGARRVGKLSPSCWVLQEIKGIHFLSPKDECEGCFWLLLVASGCRWAGPPGRGVGSRRPERVGGARLQFGFGLSAGGDGGFEKLL